MTSAIPLIDIEPFSQGKDGQFHVGREFARACENVGFVCIKNHGVSSDVIRDCWEAGQSFFDLPLEKRMEARPLTEGHPYGYAPMKSEALGATQDLNTEPDLKEAYTVGPIRVPPGFDDPVGLQFGYAENVWPPEMHAFRQALETYFDALNSLGGRLMEIFAVALNLKLDWFHPYVQHPVSALRILNYPAPESVPQSNQYRAGPHTDYGCLTILLPQESAGGLQVLSRGEWQTVPVIPETFVINIGDMMARWTNDRWVSTMHQVVNPPEPGDESTRRQSIAFFYQPAWNAEVRCIPSCLAPGADPKYPPVFAGEHLAMKYGKSVCGA